jgi:hypothetical protein
VEEPDAVRLHPLLQLSFALSGLIRTMDTRRAIYAPQERFSPTLVITVAIYVMPEHSAGRVKRIALRALRDLTTPTKKGQPATLALQALLA